MSPSRAAELRGDESLRQTARDVRMRLLVRRPLTDLAKSRPGRTHAVV